MEYPPLLREIMRAGQLRQVDLAKRLKVTQPTVSRLLRGIITDPGRDLHDRIVTQAQRLGVMSTGDDGTASSGGINPGHPTPPPTAPVPVVGYVGAGAEAHYYAVSQGDLDEVPAPAEATENTVAVEVRGDSLGSMFNRWLAFYDDVRRPVTPDLIGKLCVVGLETGQILVKKVQRGRARGTYTLVSDHAPPIEDATVEWAARVKHMAPRA